MAIAAAGVSLLSYPVVAADGPVASVQKTLKEQQFYFGEVTGRLDEETRAAVRRYQIHQGLPVTAELDTATLAALQGSSEEAAAQDGSDGERSIRGLAKNSVQDDREFLQQMEGMEEGGFVPGPPPANHESSTTTGVDVEVDVRHEEQRRTQQVAPPPIAERPEPEERDAQTQPPEPVRREKPPGLSEEEAQRFVQDYLEAAEQPTPDEELSFFANQVDYFDSGKVSRSFIEKDQRNYYKRWTSRDFDLLGEPEIIRSSENSATVRFRMQYNVRGKNDSARGKTEEIMRLRREDGEWRISGIRERKLSD